MKLRKAPKGLKQIKYGSDYPRKFEPSQDRVMREHMQSRHLDTERWLQEQEARQRAQSDAATTSPLTAHEAGVGYRGPLMADKGKRDGSCNVTACQMPLLGKPQFIMRPEFSGGAEMVYCKRCNDGFRRWDEIDRPGTYRCEADPRNDALSEEAWFE